MAPKLAIVLPGRAYTALGPAIRFPVLALMELGFTVREIAYPDVPDGEGTFPWEDFSAATADRIAAAASGAAWDETIVVAKSLGTGVLARIGQRLGVTKPRAIWLTPLFQGAAVRAGASALGWPSLLVIGTADEAYHAAGFEQVAHSLGAETLLIDGADHGLEIPGDAAATLDAMRRLVDVTLAFAAG